MSRVPFREGEIAAAVAALQPLFKTVHSVQPHLFFPPSTAAPLLCTTPPLFPPSSRACHFHSPLSSVSLSLPLPRQQPISAMSVPNGSKGSKGKFGERYLGINRLAPPPVHDVSGSDLPMSITLGQYSLQLDGQTGQWKLQEGLIATLQQQVASLQQQLLVAQKEAALGQQPSQQASSVDGLEWERRLLEMEKSNIQLLNDNAQLRFKSKVLTAMCAIAEGDYQRLCDEVGVDNDSSVRRVQSAASDGRDKAAAAVAEYSFSSTLNAGMAAGEMKRDGSFSRTQRYESSSSEHDRTIKAPLRYQMQAGAV